MVAPIHANKRGIYKDLYREIDADNKKREISQAKKPNKGIYIGLYKQFEHDKNMALKGSQKDKEKISVYVRLIQIIQKCINFILSKVSYFCSAATSEVKMLILAFMVTKKPLNNYIENKLPIYINRDQSQGQNLGFYYNDR